MLIRLLVLKKLDENSGAKRSAKNNLIKKQLLLIILLIYRITCKLMQDVSGSISTPWRRTLSDPRILHRKTHQIIASIISEGLMKGTLKGFADVRIETPCICAFTTVPVTQDAPRCAYIRVPCTGSYPVGVHTCVGIIRECTCGTVHSVSPFNAKDDRLGRVGRSWSGWHPPRRCGDSETCMRAYMHVRTIIHGVPEKETIVQWVNSRIRSKNRVIPLDYW